MKSEEAIKMEVIICYDFDGTLCEYNGWGGHDKIGKPLRHPKDKRVMVDIVKELSDMGVILKLSTTRLNPYPFGDKEKPEEVVTSGKSKEYIERWLKKYDILRCFSEITGYKPYADKYIDDRGWFPTHQELMEWLYPVLGIEI